MHKEIVEKELGISPDYQYRALFKNNFIQANWHRNKMYVTEILSRFNKKMKVLDLGTGSGNFEILFNRRVEKIVGVDYNDDALKFLKGYLKDHKINNVDLLLGNIKNLKLPKKDSKFDLIVMIDVIEHLHFQDVKKLFKKFTNYLKDGGRVVIVTPNYRSLWPTLEYLFDLFGLAPKFQGHQHLSKLYQANLKKLIVSNGFNLERICSFNLFSYLFPSPKLSKALCRLETLIPFPVGNLITVVFSKPGKKLG